MGSAAKVTGVVFVRPGGGGGFRPTGPAGGGWPRSFAWGGGPWAHGVVMSAGCAVSGGMWRIAAVWCG
ncbi:hypothetical protein CP973_29185 [Streptomyces albofaciens JCM 4342]|nr:hypothetical protein CP973_29185 [Streptomyces albofaciens JCM 4342]